MEISSMQNRPEGMEHIKTIPLGGKDASNFIKHSPVTELSRNQ